VTRRVIVTGGSRGIGAEVCRAFAALGDQVVVHYSSGAGPAQDVLASLPGTGHTTLQADLRDPASIKRMVDEAAAHLGGIDVLVNNAGIFIDHPPLTTGYAEWQEAFEQTMAVNLFGPANTIWCAVPHMPSGSRIVTVGSRGAFRGEPTAPAYAASKAAVTSMCQSLAQSLAPKGIAVLTLAPGFVATDMAAELLASPAGDSVRNQSPHGRVAEAAEVAQAVVALAGPWSTWASGSVVDFNGASYLRV
jgi:NAD(P)-dependent dehydrogenase (short-subunit alcohol dehydrogenase family)